MVITLNLIRVKLIHEMILFFIKTLLLLMRKDISYLIKIL